MSYTDSAPPVSGPGKLSRRTDKGPAQKIRQLPDAQYGEAATYKDLQQQAPLAQTPAPSPAGSARGGSPGGGPNLVPFSAPTALPDQPVTHGADAGAGAGPEALGLPAAGVTQWQSARDVLHALVQRDPNDSALAYLAARLQGRY